MVYKIGVALLLRYATLAAFVLWSSAARNDFQQPMLLTHQQHLFFKKKLVAQKSDNEVSQVSVTNSLTFR
uniref:Uncharacterized protein n=1 Tax=Solanum lycopersicum TaxID=4081 RepID=K4B1J3_SOLLC